MTKERLIPHDDDGQDDPFVSIAESLPKIKPPSMVKRRLIESAVAIDADDPESVVYQHTVLCQTCLPHRDPGADVRWWQRSQDSARLEIEAGRALDPVSKEFVDVGLPFGPKPQTFVASVGGNSPATPPPQFPYTSTRLIGR